MTYPTGTSVLIDPEVAPAEERGVVWTVVRNGPKNTMIAHPDSHKRGLRVPPQFLTAATPEQIEEADRNGGRIRVLKSFTADALGPNLAPGMVVTVDAVKCPGAAGQGLLVVTKRAGDRVDLVRLGGDEGGRFWKGVPLVWCGLVDVAALGAGAR